jgi:ABC-2 type transport system ATP-binding protein
LITGDLEVPGAMVIKNSNERASIIVETDKVPVSDVLANISKKMDLIDVTIENTPIENVIVNLYKEHEI